MLKIPLTKTSSRSFLSFVSRRMTAHAFGLGLLWCLSILQHLPTVPDIRVYENTLIMGPSVPQPFVFGQHSIPIPLCLRCHQYGPFSVPLTLPLVRGNVKLLTNCTPHCPHPQSFPSHQGHQGLPVCILASSIYRLQEPLLLRYYLSLFVHLRLQASW